MTNTEPVLTSTEAQRLFAAVALSEYPVTADEMVAATGIPRHAVVGGLAQLIRMEWVALTDDDDRENRYFATEK